MTRQYPDEAVGGFPTPPREITDGEGRTIQIQHATDEEGLVSMYREFDAADRAQGIPPVGEEAVREWLDDVLAPSELNIVGRHDGRTIGHVLLVGDEEYELAIFVLQAYQGAGIGTELLRTALGAASEHDIEFVWLSVERWNRAAKHLYRSVGFEPIDAPHFEMEMTLRLSV